MPPKLLSEEKDLAICRLLTGWDTLEKKLGGSAIIDFNLPGFFDPDHITRYTARYDVLAQLQTLQCDTEIKADKRLLQKLHAHEVYLRNVMGEHWDFESYIENTSGFIPLPISEDDLAARRQHLEKSLQRWNLAIDQNLDDRFSAIQEEIPETEIAAFYHNIFERNAEALGAIIGPIPQFTFTVEFDDVDANWKNWVDGRQKDYRLRFNKRTMPSFGKASCTLLALHEIMSHLVQAAFLYQKIEQGVVPLCMGITSVHGPEQFLSEGLAMTLPYFLETEDAQDPLVQTACEIYLYEKMVWNNNAHIMINSGATIEECTDYVVERMPYKTRNEIAHSLASSMNDPQMRCYKHVYGGSAIFFQDIALRADKSQKEAFLKRIYNDWLPADELAGFSKELFRSAKTNLNDHAQRAHIDVQQLFLFLAVARFKLTQADYLAHDLDVEAGALRLGEHILDVVGNAFLFLLQALDALDKGFQAFGGNVDRRRCFNRSNIRQGDVAPEMD